MIPKTEEGIKKLLRSNKEKLKGKTIKVPDDPDSEKPIFYRYFTITGIGPKAIRYNYDHTSKYIWGEKNVFLRYEDIARNARKEKWAVPFLKKVLEIVKSK